MNDSMQSCPECNAIRVQFEYGENDHGYQYVRITYQCGAKLDRYPFSPDEKGRDQSEEEYHVYCPAPDEKEVKV